MQPHSNSNDLEALRLLNDEFIRAVRMSDVSWFEAYLAEDFLNSNPDGTLVDRVAFLKQIAPPCPVSNFDVGDVRIRLFDGAAIIHGRTTYIKASGQAGTGRYTDVWAFEEGCWRCKSGDVTRG